MRGSRRCEGGVTPRERVGVYARLVERVLELIGYPADAAKWRVAHERSRVLEARAA